MTGTVDVMELLNKAYTMKFEEVMNEKNPIKTMKGSGVEFQIWKGGRYDTYKWEVHFEKSFEFGYGNWSKYYFDSDLALGKFLFECEANGGLPQGALGIVNN